MRLAAPLLCLAALAAGVPLAIAAQQAPELTGVVRSSDGIPLRGAEIGIVDGAARTTTNDSGRYVLRDVPTGTVVFFARAIGYLPTTFVVAMGFGSQTRDVGLQTAATALPEIRAYAKWAKPARLAHTTKYDDFYRRRKAGFGTFLTRDVIERSTAMQAFELLRGIPGINVTWNPPGVVGTEVRFVRCQDPTRVGIWIDGVRQVFNPRLATEVSTGPIASPEARSRMWQEWLELIGRVRPSEIEAMEIFRGSSQVPGEFLDNSCGAVVIWTREGGSRRLADESPPR
ncbi:MAG: carboxypeptidase regulatory-like domain-containing protein [Gemmatimonadales bacterium]